MDGRGEVCGSFRRPKQYPGASLEAGTKGRTECHTHTRRCHGSSGGGGGDSQGVETGLTRTEGTWSDSWAVFTLTPHTCKVSAGTALFDPNGPWSHFTVEETEAERFLTTVGRASSGTQGS